MLEVNTRFLGVSMKPLVSNRRSNGNFFHQKSHFTDALHLAVGCAKINPASHPNSRAFRGLFVNAQTGPLVAKF